VYNMSNSSAMTPMSIPDPVFIKGKAFLAQGAGYDHSDLLC